jgi:hypothetical protein
MACVLLPRLPRTGQTIVWDAVLRTLLGGEVTLQARTEVGDRIGDLDVPQAHGAVGAAGEHTLAIGGEGDCTCKANRSRMANEPPHLLPGRRIPQLRHAVDGD